MHEEVIIKAPSGRKLIIESEEKKARYRIPPYQPYGKAGMNSYDVRGLDTASIFLKLSPTAHWLWWSLVLIRNERTNMSILKSKDLTKYEQNKVSKAYGELYQEQLVKRVKREHYLLNPKAMVPNFDQYVTVQERWESI